MAFDGCEDEGLTSCDADQIRMLDCLVGQTGLESDCSWDCPGIGSTAIPHILQDLHGT